MNIEEYTEFKPEYIYTIKPMDMVNVERAAGNTYVMHASVKISFGEPLSQEAPDNIIYVCISINSISQGVDTPWVIKIVVKTVTNNTPNFSMLFSLFNVTPHFSMIIMVKNVVIIIRITILANKLVAARAGITDRTIKIKSL